MKELETRGSDGRFVAGQSGNPQGRAKGLRNFITEERLALEKALRVYVAQPERCEQLLAGIDRVLEIAVNGADKDAISAMKLLLDRTMPAMPPKLEEEAGTAIRKLEVVIITNPGATVPIEVLSGEFTVKEESTNE